MAESTIFSRQFLNEAAEILKRLDTAAIDRAVFLLAETRRRNGRLFILGVGGSAANASHAVNDFRKIAGFAAYAPTDNVSELSARINDEVWASVLIPTINPVHVTPHAEAFQAVIWRLMVSHPDLKAGETKWESLR